MQKYTRFLSFDNLVENCPFFYEQDGREVLISDEWSTYISEHSVFSDWEEMKIQAMKEWIEKNLKPH